METPSGALPRLSQGIPGKHEQGLQHPAQNAGESLDPYRAGLFRDLYTLLFGARSPPPPHFRETRGFKGGGGLLTPERNFWKILGFKGGCFLLVRNKMVANFCANFGANLASSWRQVGAKLAPKLARS